MRSSAVQLGTLTLWELFPPIETHAGITNMYARVNLKGCV